jgi:mannose-6-phosphate isomerase-like protein (cupin superfamily)
MAMTPTLELINLITTNIHVIPQSLAEDVESWRRFPAFAGATPVLSLISCHVSVLSPGQASPHPPHAHSEEEILVVISGRARLTIATADAACLREEILCQGGFVYYPASHSHTISNPFDQPVTYLMLKWVAPKSTEGKQLPCQLVDSPPHIQTEANSLRFVCPFEGPTAYLAKLHAHYTMLGPGGGYAPHSDDYDVAIILLSGRIETLATEVEAPAVIYWSAKQLHGLRNIGAEAARYLVIEFHRHEDEASEAIQTAPASPPAIAPIIAHEPISSTGWAMRLRSRLRAELQWLRYGDHILDSGLFSADWYLSNYPDVAKCGVNPLRHYLVFGAKEGRIPSQQFDGPAYLAANPDVRRANANPVLHFLLFGRAEGRKCHIPQSVITDAEGLDR